MTIQYVKNSEGTVSVVETIVKDPVIKDLHELKLRKAELEQTILDKQDLILTQRQWAFAKQQEVTDGEIKEMQVELTKINADIDGAVAAGVVEVIPDAPPINMDPANLP